VSDGPSTAQAASDQAQEVASTAAERGKAVVGATSDQAQQVMATARDQASQVTHQASVQASKVVDDVKTHLQGQASDQTDQMGEVLGRLAGQLEALADGRPQDAGPAADLVRQAAGQVGRVAARTKEGGFDGAVADLQRFARRRPVVFLAGAMTAGLALGRLLRAGRESGALNPAASETSVPPGQQASDSAPLEAPGLAPALEAYSRGTTMEDTASSSSAADHEAPR
jgi:hypothetical protein